MTQQLSQRSLLEAAAEGLRRLASDPWCRATFAAPGSALRNILAPAARRYVLAPDRAGFLARSALLRAEGYRVTAEYTVPGRPGADRAQAALAVEEYVGLLGHRPAPDRIGFDLSLAGFAHSPELATENTGRIAAAAALRGSEVVLNADRSPGADGTLAVYGELARRHQNLGITLQACLRRTEADAAAVARPGSTVRLVKGALPEPPHTALARGPALDDRFLDLAEFLVDRGVKLSLATHDPVVLAAAQERGLLERVAEIEMLHGVQPELLRRYHEAGIACRIHAVYGTEWWLHVLQRLAEHPPMVLTALADIGREQA
jgi:proline dehydrogenase